MGHNLNDKGRCSLCGNRCQSMVVDLPFFRHLDFKTVANSNKVTICLECGVVDNKKLFTESESIFRRESLPLNRCRCGSLDLLLDGWPFLAPYRQACPPDSRIPAPARRPPAPSPSLAPHQNCPP